MRPLRSILPVFVLVLLLQTPASIARAQDDVVHARAAVIKSRSLGLVAGGRFPDVGAAAESWAERSPGPHWLDGGKPSKEAQELLARFERASELGLRPRDYATPQLVAEAKALAGAGGADAARAARFDVAMDVAALRYLDALCRGRVPPEAAHATLRIAKPDFDVVPAADSLAQGRDVDGVISRVQPPWRHYRLLLPALARYRSIAKDSTLVPLPGLPKTLKPGAKYDHAAQLRRLLLALGDLPVVQARIDIADTLYDSTLVWAVRNFQGRQGLKADGVLGPGTAQGLNRPLGERVREIELALERWRWLPRSFDEPPIIVNVPAFRLYAFQGPSDAEAEMLPMDVVVGRAYKSDTPLFTETMKYVVFSPYWEVPSSIATGEIRPHAMRDPEWLEKNDYELVQGSTVVPASGSAIAAIGRGVRVRQKPGPDNALGRIKFMFPNPYAIYLHDTNSKGRFAAERRDFSHGCIRVSAPVALAHHVLRHQPAWTSEKIEEAMNGNRPRQVNLERPIPVLILYTTATADESGRLHLYRDIYGLDDELDALLARGYPFR